MSINTNYKMNKCLNDEMHSLIVEKHQCWEKYVNGRLSQHLNRIQEIIRRQHVIMDSPYKQLIYPVE